MGGGSCQGPHYVKCIVKSQWKKFQVGDLIRVMIMIAPNSHARQKEGVPSEGKQGGREGFRGRGKWWEIKETELKKAKTFPAIFFRSGMWDTRKDENKKGRGCLSRKDWQGIDKQIFTSNTLNVTYTFRCASFSCSHTLFPKFNDVKKIDKRTHQFNELKKHV